MGYFFGTVLLSVAAIMQATFVPQVRLLGGGPDLVFLLVLSWAINAELESSVVWAVLGGLFLDLLSLQPTGTSILGLVFIVFLVGGIGRQVYRMGVFILVGLVILGTVIQQAAIMAILTLMGFRVDWLYSATYVVAPTIVYNLLLIGPLYWFVRRTQRRIQLRGATER